jgi:ADP-ribose pyrophosphatase YjhB (NUDIX family)
VGWAPAGPTLATLVYCLRGGQVLLLQRAKPPFPGSWVAPGGKVDQLFFDPVVLGTGEPYERTFHYDAQLRLLPA